MAVYDEKSNTYILSRNDKFRLFKIKHKSVDGIAYLSIVMPAVTASFCISIFGYALLLLWWWIGVSPDDNIRFYVSTMICWIVGIVLGIIGSVPLIIWIIYIPLFLNTIYFIICEMLDDIDVKQGKPTLDLLYKQNKIN